MKRLLLMVLWFVVGFATAQVALACTFTNYDNPTPGDPACKTHQKHIVMMVSPDFTAEERAQIQNAALDWGTWTKGRATIQIKDYSVLDVRAGMIERLTSSSSTVQEYDASQREKYKDPNYEVLAWTSNYVDSAVIHLIVDRISDIYGTTAHEMGHALGLEWPNCQNEERAPFVQATGSRDCDHSADPGALMFPAYHTPETFNATDLAMCQSSCLCD